MTTLYTDKDPIQTTCLQHQSHRHNVITIHTQHSTQITQRRLDLVTRPSSWRCALQ